MWGITIIGGGDPFRVSKGPWACKAAVTIDGLVVVNDGGDTRFIVFAVK